MRSALHTIGFQVLCWVFAYNLIGIPLYFFFYDVRDALDPSMPFGFWLGLLTNCAGGVVVGVALGLIDLATGRWLSRRRTFRSLVLIKSLTYMAFFGLLVVVFGVAVRTPQVEIEEAVEGATSSSGIYIMVGYFLYGMGFSVIVSFLVQVRRLVGQDVALPLLLGRYFVPREEDRAFLFLDLSDSTAIAEALGHRRFGQFVQECIYDVNRVAAESGAEIYKYVGDEAILTWSARTAGARGIACYFALEERIRSRANFYREQFGRVPAFKAGLHRGPVLVTEIGDFKRELAYHGDVLNTTARIQAVCGDLGAAMLVSPAIASEARGEEGLVLRSRGEFSLKGKAEPLELFEPVSGAPTRQ